MKIAYHGGKCCGIKIIHGLPMGTKCFPLEKSDKPYYDAQRSGLGSQSTETNVFCLDAPKEDGFARFDRYVKFMRENQLRGNGLLEVTTNSYRYCIGRDPETLEIKYSSQTDYWREHLESHGFKAVTSFVNGNSTYTVTVWHLAYGPDNEKGE